MTDKQTIFITGASGGIGKATAQLFQLKGWNVVATARDTEKARDLSELSDVIVVPMDVTDVSSVQGAIEQGVKKFGKIDVLLNNAGFGVYGPLEATSMEKVRKIYETNVFGYLETIKAVLPLFRAQKGGVIINVSSVGGKITFPLGTLYHGTKFAVEGMSEALSFELEPIGIRVKIIEPGDTLTDFKIDFTNDESMTEYQPLVRSFPDHYAPIKAKGSDPIVPAEVIYRAATDGSRQLRYTAGDDAKSKIAQRKIDDDATWMRDMRRQFGL